MKKRFLSTVILAAAATILIGGCEQQGSGEDGERGGNFSGSMTNQQVYLSDGNTVPATGTYTLNMAGRSKEGGLQVQNDDVGKVIDGKLTLTLPASIKTKELWAVFGEQGVDLEGTVNPADYKVFFVEYFAVYDDNIEYIGKLHYRAKDGPETSVPFLYCPMPLTISAVELNKNLDVDFSVGTGWNTLLITGDTMTAGVPPPDAKWYFSPDSQSSE
jgi:hypothetical protein